MTNTFIYLAKMSNLTWKLNSLFWVILSQNLCKFCYSFWPILCPAKAAFDNNKTTAKNRGKFVITWPVSLLSLIKTNALFPWFYCRFRNVMGDVKREQEKRMIQILDNLKMIRLPVGYIITWLHCSLGQCTIR